MPEHEARLVRACLAALARRTGSGALVISYEEIEREYQNGAQVQCASDCGAKCVRISIPVVKE